MHMISISERIRRTAQEVIEKFAFYRIGIFDIKKEEAHSKQRIRQLLADSKELGEIADFLPVNKVRKGKKRFYPDFLVTVVVKNGRRQIKFLKVRVFQKGANAFLERQDQRKVYKKDFIEMEVIVGGGQISDKELRQEWKKILKGLKES